MWNLMHFLPETGWLLVRGLAYRVAGTAGHGRTSHNCLFIPLWKRPTLLVWGLHTTWRISKFLGMVYKPYMYVILVTKLAWAWILCLCNCWVRYWFMNESMLSLWMVKDFDFDFCCLQNGASSCTSELTLFRNGEIHCWDRAYDDSGNQVSIFTCASYFCVSAS
jgi:hypothetical protein